MVKEVDLLSYLPPHLRKLKEFREIAKAETPEIILILEAIDKYLRNMFIETADEDGISVFEGLLGIFPAEDESLESRRLRVALRWNNKNLRLNERLISLCGKDGYKLINDNLKNYTLKIITHLRVDGEFNIVSSILVDIIPCNLILELKNILEDKNTSHVNAVVISCVAMRYQITNDVKSAVNQSSCLNVAQVLSTGGLSGTITMDIAVKDEVQSPHYEGVGVGMAFAKIITHDINSKATNSGNTTVASPVNTATVITIN